MTKMTNIFKNLTAIATVGMLLLPTTATAQNLLVNGDFEADPYPVGNNVLKPVTGWHAGRPNSDGTTYWPLGNVVGVDGDGPSTWGTPQSDATGGNNLQHYLDGYGKTLVWQHFRAPCSGRARASMSYSVRDGGTGSSAKFSWEPRMGPPVSLPIPSSTVINRTNIPAPGIANLLNEANFLSEAFSNGTPQNHWTQFQYTKPLVGGQLYTFLVDLEQKANIDNASVEMIDACEGPLDTQETSIQKSCQPPAAGIHNGVLGQIWSCQINVNATPTPFSGTLTVTDAPSQSSGNTSGTVVSMTSASGNFDCSAPDSCTIDGTDFTSGTETINVQTFVQTTDPLGAGSSASYQASNCASGGYQNGDDITALNGNCVNANFRPSISSLKACEPVEAVADGPMTLNCTITVNGSNLASSGYVQVMELFGANSPTQPNIVGPMSFTSNENWNCIGAPTQPNFSLCELPTIDMFNAGGTSTINVSIPFEAGPDITEISNCGPSLYGATSYIEQLNQNNSRQQKQKSSFFDADYCTTIAVPPKSLPPLKEVKIDKSCSKPEVGDIKGKPGVFWECTITVQADPAPFSGTFELEEDASAISGSGSGDIVSVSHQNNNWVCQQTLPSSATACEIDGEDFSPSGTETLTFTLFSGIDDNKPIKWENCATGKYRPYKKEAENMGGDCDTMSWTPLPPVEKVELSKSCTEPKKVEHEKASGLFWQCTIEVHAEPAPFDGLITFLEDATALSGSNNGNIIDVNHANQAWACLPNAPVQATTCQINGANFSPSGTETVTFDLFVETGEEPVKWDNCVTGQYTYRKREKREIKGNCETMTWKPDEIKQTTYDIKKICKPRGDRQNLSDTEWIQAYRCQITVTTNGVPFSGPLFVQDNLTVAGGTHPQVINGMSSSDPWNCTQPSYTPGNTPSCWISGSQFPHSNGSSTINVDLVISSNMAQKGVSNCSVLNTIESGSDKPKPIGESCSPIVGDIDDGKPELTVAKTCAKPTRNGSVWNVACQVTISGSNLPAGTPIRLSDDMQSVQGYTASSGTLQSSGALCNGNVNSGGVYAGCDLSSDDLANGPLVFNYVGAFTSLSAWGQSRTAQNCVYADAPGIGLHAPTGGNRKLCVPLQLGLVVVDGGSLEAVNNGNGLLSTPKRNLKITKTQRDSCTAGSVCRFHIGVLNTGDVPMNIPQIVDQFTPPNGVTVQSSSLPWVCSMSGGNVICNPSTPMTLQPGSGMTMTVNLNVPRNLTGEVGNCARLNWLPYAVPYQDRSIRSVQQALTNKGFKPGPVDGSFGKLTSDAIRRFERQNGLPVTGVVNEKMASLLFGVLKPLDMGDDIKADDNSCININYQPAEPLHSRKQSNIVNHNTYRSSLVGFHRQYKSSLHDGKSTKLRHDRRKSEVGDHDKRVSRVHRQFKSDQHDARTTQIIVEHNRYRSRLRDFHKKYKSKQHDGKVTRLRHDRRKSVEQNHDRRLSRFHRKYKSAQHDERTTKIRHEHSKSRSAMRDFHKRFKSSQHDGKTTRLRHDRRKSVEQNHDKRLSRFHRKYKSVQHDERTTKIRREHSKSRSVMRDFHKKFKSSQHDGKTTGLRHDRRKSVEQNHDKRISRFHRRFKSVLHDPKTSRVRLLKPRLLEQSGQIKK